MPNLIANVHGYTPDPTIGLFHLTAGTAYAVGDILQLGRDSDETGPGLNSAVTPVVGNESTSRCYGVVLAAVSATDIEVKLQTRGMVKCVFIEATAITNTAMNLVCSVFDTAGDDVSLTNAVDITTVAGGNASKKIIALYTNNANAVVTGNIQEVMFNGIEGFGMANAQV